MLIRTALSRALTAKAAIGEISAGLDLGRHGVPSFAGLHFGVGLPGAALQDAAKAAFPGAALHGGSSCLGVMSQDALNIDTGAGAGAIAIWDDEGSFGTASADLGTDPEATARTVAHAALLAAGRSGEVPDLVWLTVAPGREERVLAGLRAVFGAQTPIFGGSSADNDVSGAWAQFGPDALHHDGVVVSVLFPSVPIFATYQSGYAPSGPSGTVTRASGRQLIEIDGRPAAQVYAGWTGDAVPEATDSARSILAEATLWPLGRVTRHIAGVPFHLLAHPAVSHPDGAIDLFADVAAGDVLWQMNGSVDNLVARAGRIAAQARADAGGAIAGALVVYCGGCLLASRARMHEVRAEIDLALGNAPWLGIFTFGEQGMPVGGHTKHGNLMISCTVFANS